VRRNADMSCAQRRPASLLQYVCFARFSLRLLPSFVYFAQTPREVVVWRDGEVEKAFATEMVEGEAVARA